MKIDVKAELARRKSTTTRMLEAFKLRQKLTTNDLNKFGNGCSSRLFELRKEGHKILAVYDRPGLYTYFYMGHSDDEKDKPLPRSRQLFRKRTLEQED